jgi:small subunit ribosomal protein S9
LNELKSLERKYTNLPRVANIQGKWLSMQQYEPMAGDERLKSSQHKQLVKLLNRLNSIDPQLRPTEVQQLLTKYSRSSNINESGKKHKELDQYGRSRTVGGRKSSSATVHLVKGTGEFLVNGKPLNQHFPELKHREEILYPFKVIEAESEYNVFAIVTGGGPTGQAGAIVSAIGQGLIIHNPLLKARLYKAGCITRDHRRVERKKPGKLKARKSPTWVKR